MQLGVLSRRTEPADPVLRQPPLVPQLGPGCAHVTGHCVCRGPWDGSPQVHTFPPPQLLGTWGQSWQRPGACVPGQQLLTGGNSYGPLHSPCFLGHLGSPWLCGEPGLTPLSPATSGCRFGPGEGHSLPSALLAQPLSGRRDSARTGGSGPHGGARGLRGPGVGWKLQEQKPPGVTELFHH